jgi:F0F1-type ATP synthase membrane subunit c/vacuolar-type H+-ATPase subunit K
MGMLFAPVIYAVEGLSGILKPVTSTGVELPLLPILACASLVLAIAAAMLRGRLFDRVSGMSPNDPARSSALMQASVIPWAFDETIGVFGLVLMILGRPPLQWLPFCAASFALLMLHAPRNDA